ncbi:MAG: hypothetical protein ACHQ1D_11545, partial [Nitrososphaerales archaeon]
VEQTSLKQKENETVISLLDNKLEEEREKCKNLEKDCENLRIVHENNLEQIKTEFVCVLEWIEKANQDRSYLKKIFLGDGTIRNFTDGTLEEIQELSNDILSGNCTKKLECECKSLGETFKSMLIEMDTTYNKECVDYIETILTRRLEIKQESIVSEKDSPMELQSTEKLMSSGDQIQKIKTDKLKSLLAETNEQKSVIAELQRQDEEKEKILEKMREESGCKTALIENLNKKLSKEQSVLRGVLEDNGEKEQEIKKLQLALRDSNLVVDQEKPRRCFFIAGRFIWCNAPPDEFNLVTLHSTCVNDKSSGLHKIDFLQSRDVNLTNPITVYSVKANSNAHSAQSIGRSVQSVYRSMGQTKACDGASNCKTKLYSMRKRYNKLTKGPNLQKDPDEIDTGHGEMSVDQTSVNREIKQPNGLVDSEQPSGMLSLTILGIKRNRYFLTGTKWVDKCEEINSRLVNFLMRKYIFCIVRCHVVKCRYLL